MKMKWISKDQHCEPHCKNLTESCYSCEEHDDCNCELVESIDQPERASEKTPNKCYKCDKQVDENGAIWKDTSSGISYPICADCLSKIFIKRCGAPNPMETPGDNQK